MRMESSESYLEELSSLNITWEEAKDLAFDLHLLESSHYPCFLAWEKMKMLTVDISVDIFLKWIVHPKMKILSGKNYVFTICKCLCSAEHKGRYSEECGEQSSSGALLTLP